MTKYSHLKWPKTLQKGVGELTWSPALADLDEGVRLENFPAPNLPPFALPPLAGCIKRNTESVRFITKLTKKSEIFEDASTALSDPGPAFWHRQLAGLQAVATGDISQDSCSEFAIYRKRNSGFLICWLMIKGEGTYHVTVFVCCKYICEREKRGSSSKINSIN